MADGEEIPTVDVNLEEDIPTVDVDLGGGEPVNQTPQDTAIGPSQNFISIGTGGAGIGFKANMPRVAMLSDFGNKQRITKTIDNIASSKPVIDSQYPPTEMELGTYASANKPIDISSDLQLLQYDIANTKPEERSAIVDYAKSKGLSGHELNAIENVVDEQVTPYVQGKSDQSRVGRAFDNGTMAMFKIPATAITELTTGVDRTEEYKRIGSRIANAFGYPIESKSQAKLLEEMVGLERSNDEKFYDAAADIGAFALSATITGAIMPELSLMKFKDAARASKLATNLIKTTENLGNASLRGGAQFGAQDLIFNAGNNFPESVKNGASVGLSVGGANMILAAGFKPVYEATINKMKSGGSVIPSKVLDVVVGTTIQQAGNYIPSVIGDQKMPTAEEAAIMAFFDLASTLAHVAPQKRSQYIESKISSLIDSGDLTKEEAKEEAAAMADALSPENMQSILEESNISNKGATSESKADVAQDQVAGQPPEISIKEPASITNKSGGEADISTKRQKAFLETVSESDKTKPEFKAVADELEQFYSQISNKESLKSADKKIRENFEEAVKSATDPNDISAESTVTGIRLIKHYEKIGDFDSAINILESVDSKLRSAGQAIQAATLWNKLSPETMVRIANKISKEKLGTPLDKDVKAEILRRMSEIEKMPDGQEKTDATISLLDFTASKIPLTKMEKFDAYRYQNMLSNPLAHLRNIYGNAFNVFVTEPSTLGVRSLYEKANIGVDKDNMASAVKFSDVPVYYKDVAESIGPAIKFAATAFKERNFTNKNFDVGDTKSSIESMRKATTPEILSFSTRLLEAEDRFFTTLIASAEKSRLMRSGIGEATATEKAKKVADAYLYRDRLNPKSKENLKIVNALESMGNGLDKLRKLPNIGRGIGWMVPFVRTPVKVAAMSAKYSPFATLEMAIGKAAKGKEYSSTQLAAATIGSLVSAIGAYKAVNDDTEWAAPKDPKAKEAFYASGRKPYSIRIGDNWIPMQYFGPLAFSLAIPAAVKYYAKDQPNALTDSQVEKITEGILKSNTFMLKQTPLQGLSDFMDVIDGEKDLSKMAGSTAGQVIPLSGLWRYVNDWVDPVFRKSKTGIDQIKSGIPTLSNELEPYTEPATSPLKKPEPSKKEPLNNLVPYDIGINKQYYEIMLKNRRKLLQENAKKRKKDE